MKKTLLLSFLLFAPLLVVQAQFFRYGVKVGGGFSTAVGQDAPSDQINNLAGLHVGPVLTYEFVSPVAVQAELHYSMKGFVYDNFTRDDITVPETALAGDLRLNYLELPLLFKIRKAALFGEAGPYMGYLLNINSDVNTVDNLSDPPLILEHRSFSRDDFNSFDYGYAIGGGLILDNGLFMSVRNTGSLRPFPKDDLKQRNLAWQLSIGYLMPARGASNW
ncbi:hypothetical protein OB13_13095 [Pontibacter sp. HJ8]